MDLFHRKQIKTLQEENERLRKAVRPLTDIGVSLSLLEELLTSIAPSIASELEKLRKLEEELRPETSYRSSTSSDAAMLSGP